MSKFAFYVLVIAIVVAAAIGIAGRIDRNVNNICDEDKTLMPALPYLVLIALAAISTANARRLH